jgi:hypothetical protein
LMVARESDWTPAAPIVLKDLSLSRNSLSFWQPCLLTKRTHEPMHTCAA